MIKKRLVYLEDILADLYGVLEAAKVDPDEIMRMAEACVGTIIKHFEKFPTVDAVEVVRCKDCKFRKSTFSGEDYFCTVWDADDSETAYVTDSDFCSYGERRTDEALQKLP